MSDERIKQLMEIAARPLKKPLKKKTEYNTNVSEFIADLSIKSSTKNTVPFDIIFFRYIKWCKNLNKKAASFNNFSKEFSKKFEKAGGRRTQYYISPEGFNLTAQNEQDAQAYLQEVLNNGPKKEKKTSRQPKSSKTTKS